MEKKGFMDLKGRIIDSGLCMRCGACVASCPVNVLSHGVDSIELKGECIDCGICSKVCPGGGIDLSTMEMNLFGRSRSRKLGSRLGIYKEKAHLTSSSKEFIRIGYYGGRITSILVAAMRSGLIDAALLTDWSDDRSLSLGTGKVARTEDEVRSLASSKYTFTSVLSTLREVSGDPEISKVALVGLPCNIHGLMMMGSVPETRKLTEKVEYVISLNCGAPQTDESTWRKRISSLTGLEQDDIDSLRYRKISSTGLRLTVKRKDGSELIKDMNILNFLFRINLSKHWPRCGMCPDYSGELSDISFGAPVIRTERGRKLIENAKDGGFLKGSSSRKRSSQNIVDIYVPLRKKVKTRVNIWKRRRKKLPFPEYR